MKYLKSIRDGNGKWKKFPFYYTLLALTEIDLPAARDEMRYAAPTCERLLKRSAGNGKYGKRRKVIMDRVLEC